MPPFSTFVFTGSIDADFLSVRRKLKHDRDGVLHADRPTPLFSRFELCLAYHPQRLLITTAAYSSNNARLYNPTLFIHNESNIYTSLNARFTCLFRIAKFLLQYR